MYSGSTDPAAQTEVEVTTITPELERKRRTAPTTTIIPFYWKPANQPSQFQPVRIPRNGDWGWSDSDYVRLPLARKGPRGWDVVTKSLNSLKEYALQWCNRDLTKEENDKIHLEWFEGAIQSYCCNSSVHCNFDIFRGEWELGRRLMYALPGIIDHALKLPARLRNPIPVLKQRENKIICLTRNLACSLIANAFLCTFPEQLGRNLPYFNFWSLFNKNKWQGYNVTEIVAQVKREKIKCILAYFEEMSRNPQIYENSIITFKRRFRPQTASWSTSTTKLCAVAVCSKQKLELCHKMLQVDFANKVIGGGVLNDGAVQEEIRFCISPELICARLFTESLQKNEALIVTGTMMFSSYEGYRDTFKYEPLNCTQSMIIDNLGRQGSQVVAMDALCFKPRERGNQYKPEKIDRELHKCYVAFIQGKRRTTVATGNWGCGAFNGDPQLKFIIQWMAATYTGRPGVKFHAWSDQQKKEVEEVVSVLCRKKITIAQIYSALMKFEGVLKKMQGNITVFQFLLGVL